jgi:hypothetical protein
MKQREYRLDGGQYVYHFDGRPQFAPQDTVAVAIDGVEGALHKHGTPEQVKSWQKKMIDQYREAGLGSYADAVKIYVGRFPLEEINMLVANPDAAGDFLKRLESGAMLPIPLCPNRVSPSMPESPGARRSDKPHTLIGNSLQFRKY